ncbi:MAG: hypothetical protein J0M05_08510 [Candidatus Kapabacteria bacterium]|nr:hypothetical protein [Candidatus Kapabacteria bacterium]
MVTVISQIPLRVGGKRILAGTPVEISEADAESLSGYITIISEASVSDEDIPSEDIPSEDIPSEDIPSEDIPDEDEEVSESDDISTAPRGRGRPSRSQK